MESISRISTLLESARELTLDAASAARSSSRGVAKPLDRTQIKKLLDSRNERDILDGLRRVISMMYRSQKTLPYFSSIVKNVASPNLEIKKLVYIYLTHHAEQDPDVTLLSINTIQKSLSDSNPQVRALALRTMSNIRVPVISQIVSLAIKKGVGDMSSYVRRAAALAIPKCYRLDPGQLPQLVEYLSALLADRQYYVAGPAVTAFMEVCPERLDLIHKHYRSLVKKIVDMDEWSQLSTLKLMTIYARKCFPRRTKTVHHPTKTNPSADLQDFYAENGAQQPSTSSEDTEQVPVLDPDLELLLASIRPLLHSRNSAVVVAVARVYAAVDTPPATTSYLAHAIGPLVALLRGPSDIQQTALFNLVSVCLDHPAAFAPYAAHFLIRATDTHAVRRLKLELQTLIFAHAPARTRSLILAELEHSSRAGGDPLLVREAVRAIGRCAQADAAAAPRCLALLLGQIAGLDGALAAESLTVVRHLIQLDPAAHGTTTVVRLARNLDSATDPQARATIIWLVGEFAGQGGEDNIAADVLRILLKGFADEDEVARRQIVLLAAKVYLHHLNRASEEAAADAAAAAAAATRGEGEQEQERGGFGDAVAAAAAAAPKLLEDDDHAAAKLWRHVLALVRYDTSYDVRDRARLYRALLLGVPQLATLMLLAPKPAPQAPSPSETRRGFVLGSAALVLADDDGGAAGGWHGLRGYEPLPEWVRDGEEPDPRLREGGEGGGAGAGVAALSYASGGERAAAAVRVSAAERLEGMAGGTAGVAAGRSNGTPSGVGTKTLDDWLAEGDGGDEEEESEEEESEEEDDEEEDGDEEEEKEEEEEEEESEDDDERAENARLVSY